MRAVNFIISFVLLHVVLEFDHLAIYCWNRFLTTKQSRMSWSSLNPRRPLGSGQKQAASCHSEANLADDMNRAINMQEFKFLPRPPNPMSPHSGEDLFLFSLWEPDLVGSSVLCNVGA